MSYLENLKEANSFGLTENGGITRTTSCDALMDLFAMGGAYRSRSDEDVIFLFKKAFEENPSYAMKCLFWIRDVRGGQGERRFFRVCIKWAADHATDAMKRNVQYVPEYGRWDDLYAFVGTKLENDAFKVIENQLLLDTQCKTPSLLAKWLKSENTSSAESRRLATKTRQFLNWTPRQYRKILSILRKRINIVERLMSENRWTEIEFDKIPSKAGLIYRNAFARHDLIKEKYEKFIKDEKTTVNADTLYPYEVVAQAYNMTHGDMWGRSKNVPLDDINRLAVNKYWDNLADVFDSYSFNGICVCDTSGSMWGPNGSSPINVAISIALYCAEHGKDPFANHYISFSSRPQLIKTDGVDFVDKVRRIYSTNLCENTNIEATFDMMLGVAINNHCAQEDLPENVIVISDMEFDPIRGTTNMWSRTPSAGDKTVMERIAEKWAAAGYKMPKLVFWNVDARQDNIPMKVQNGVTMVSGFSPTIFKQIMTGKTAYSLMYDILDSERYSCIC